MTAALEGGEWSAARPGHNLPRGKNRYPFTGGWVGPRAGLDGRKTSSSPGFDPGPPARSSVAIPTEIPGSHTHTHTETYKFSFYFSVNTGLLPNKGVHFLTFC